MMARSEEFEGAAALLFQMMRFGWGVLVGAVSGAAGGRWVWVNHDGVLFASGAGAEEGAGFVRDVDRRYGV